MGVTLKQLRYFAAVARHRHFGRAAEECGVSQPALSVQVQDLEAILGAPLVERTGRSVTLTELGVEIERRARAILADAQDLVGFARHRNALLTGSLRLGVIPSIAPYLLPSVLPLLQERHADLELELREAQTRALLAELEDGALDAVLVSLPIHEPRIEAIRLFDDPFLLVTPSTARRPRGPARVSELGGDDLLLLEEGHCLRDQALAFCGTANGGTRRQYGASSLSTIVQMVANGYGRTLLPEIAVPVEAMGNPAVSAHRFVAPAPSRTIGIAWRRTSPRKPDFIALGHIVNEAAARARARLGVQSPHALG